MKVKMILLLVCVMFILPFSGKVYGEDANPEIVKANSINELDYAGSKLNDISFNSTVHFSSIILNSNVEIIGTVEQGKAFNLKGKLYQTENGNRNLIVGSLVDSLDNYEVIFFGLDSASDTGLTLNKNLLKLEMLSLNCICLKKEQET